MWWPLWWCSCVEAVTALFTPNRVPQWGRSHLKELETGEKNLKPDSRKSLKCVYGEDWGKAEQWGWRDLPVDCPYLSRKVLPSAYTAGCVFSSAVCLCCFAGICLVSGLVSICLCLLWLWTCLVVPMFPCVYVHFWALHLPVHTMLSSSWLEGEFFIAPGLSPP